MKTAPALTLWLPDLLNPLRFQEWQKLAEEGGTELSLKAAKLPSMQTLLAKADAFRAKPQSFYEQASYLYHQPLTLANAATMAAMDLTDFDEKAFWLRVDPVQMIPDRDTLVMMPASALAIEEDESKALLENFNQHFAQDAVQLEYGGVDRWYLRIVQPVDIQTTSLDAAAYQNVNDLYPKGNAATYWHQLMNEVQMLFYTHPVNEARREKGWPEINSVWVWGEGVLQTDQVKMREQAMIWSAQPYLTGLASVCGSACENSPKNHQAWYQSASENPQIEHHLVHLDDIVRALPNLSLEDWWQVMEHLEEEWFTPIFHALKQKQLSSVLLDLGNGWRYHLEPKHLKRFWRLKKSLNKLAR